MKSIAKGLQLINIENEFVNRACDIVLISSPQSDPYVTWQAQDSTKSFWPRDWLAKDFPQSRIILAQCNSDLKSLSVLEQEIKELLENMKRVGIGQVPLYFVAHSTGSMILKQLLVLSKIKKGFQHIVENTKLITFYGALMKDAKLEHYSQFLGNHPTSKTDKQEFAYYFYNSDHNYQELEISSFVYNEALKTDNKIVSEITFFIYLCFM